MVQELLGLWMGAGLLGIVGGAATVEDLVVEVGGGGEEAIAMRELRLWLLRLQKI